MILLWRPSLPPFPMRSVLGLSTAWQVWARIQTRFQRLLRSVAFVAGAAAGGGYWTGIPGSAIGHHLHHFRAVSLKCHGEGNFPFPEATAASEWLAVAATVDVVAVGGFLALKGERKRGLLLKFSKATFEFSHTMQTDADHSKRKQNIMQTLPPCDVSMWIYCVFPCQSPGPCRSRFCCS